MSVKLVVLKTGENIITDIREGILDEKIVCYIFAKPCIVFVNGEYVSNDDEPESENKVGISLQPWPIFSNDDMIEVTPDSITTIVSPNSQLEETYKSQVLGGDKIEIN